MAVLTEFVRHDRGSSFERMDALVLLARLHAKRAADGLDDWRSVARAFAGAQEQLQLTLWRTTCPDAATAHALARDRQRRCRGGTVGESRVGRGMLDHADSSGGARFWTPAPTSAHSGGASGTRRPTRALRAQAAEDERRTRRQLAGTGTTSCDRANPPRIRTLPADVVHRTGRPPPTARWYS